MPQPNQLPGTSTSAILLVFTSDLNSLARLPKDETMVRHLRAKLSRLATTIISTPGQTDQLVNVRKTPGQPGVTTPCDASHGASSTQPAIAPAASERPTRMPRIAPRP